MKRRGSDADDRRLWWQKLADAIAVALSWIVRVILEILKAGVEHLGGG